MTGERLRVPRIKANGLLAGSDTQSLSPSSYGHSEDEENGGRHGRKLSRSTCPTSHGSTHSPPRFVDSYQINNSQCLGEYHQSQIPLLRLPEASTPRSSSLLARPDAVSITPPFAGNSAQPPKEELHSPSFPDLNLEDGPRETTGKDQSPRRNPSNDSWKQRSDDTISRECPTNEMALNERIIPEISLIEMHSLQHKQQETLMLRVRARGKRTELDVLHDDVLEHDELVTQKINRWMALDDEQELLSLRPLLENSRVAREALREAEVGYSEMESRLNRLEWELKEELAKMFERINPMFKDDDLDGPKVRGYEQQEQYLDEDEPLPPPESGVDLHTYLENRYLSRKGDAYLVEEQIGDLVAERVQLLEEQQTLQRVGQGLNQDDLNFLHTFELRNAALHEDLERIQEDLANIQESIDGHKDTLFQNGQFGSFNLTPEVDVQATSDEGLHLDSSSEEDLEYYTHSVDRFVSQVAEHWYDNVYIFVNRWLLHLLENSSLQLLIMCVLQQAHIEDGEMRKVKQSVLDFTPDVRSEQLARQDGKVLKHSHESKSVGGEGDGEDDEFVVVRKRPRLAASLDVAAESQDILNSRPASNLGVRDRETTANSLLKKALGAMGAKKPSGPRSTP